MERTTSLFAICVVLLVCSAAVLADNILTAKFVERRVNREYAFMSGNLYYKYDEAHPENSRLRFVYSVGGSTVSNLYHYGDGAMYSMCSDACTGKLLTEGADPWYNRDKYYTKGKKEGDLYWFDRTKEGVTESVGAQVSSILMDTGNSASNKIQQINFTDGRYLVLSEVKHHSSGYDDMFKVDESLDCPEATCAIYADLVFVVDNSGSVDDGEWTKTVNFVNAVMDTFTFDEKAVEAAIIQFNAPEFKTYCATKSVARNCNKCKEDSVYHGNYPLPVPNERTATIVAGEDWGEGTTVSDKLNSLKTKLNAGRPTKGHTCQAFGLELAKAVLERAPRRNYQKKPAPIVIAVTDGEDNCPNRTREAAKELRDYGAFLVEIGVGIGGCNDYDINFLKEIASKIGSSTTPAYYDVKDYNAIHEVTEKLFKPLCDDFSTDCGPDCLGFCGCGKCMCPQCDETGSSCFDMSCTADESSSTGCVKSEVPCPIEDNICVSYKCDGSKYGNDRCYEEHNPCTALNQANPQECRIVTCDALKGGCKVEYSDSYCQNTFGDKCVQFKCAEKDEDITPGYEASGCYIALNKTLEREKELEKSGKINCFEPSCDPDTGDVSEDDQCPGRLTRPKCYTSKCVDFGNNVYGCQDSDGTDKGRKPDTQCVKYECTEDGWSGIVTDDEDSCTAYFKSEGILDDEDLLCLNVFCSDKQGCVWENISGCNQYCDGTKIKSCANEGHEKSSVTECHHMFCDVVFDEENNVYQPKCKENTTALNCLDDEELMGIIDSTSGASDTTECCFVTCLESGDCSYSCVEKPFNDNLCMEYVCEKKEKGFWEWHFVPSQENLTCVDNACFTRECVPSKGCKNKKDICTVNSNDCDLYTCDASGESPKCVRESLLIETTCTKEVCKDGKKVLEEYLDNCVEAQTNKCLIAKCVYNDDDKTSYCNYSNKPEPTNDPCSVFTCHPEDGTFTSEPKCKDGLFCTEDVCTVFGECKYPAVSCSELSMEGYSCFERRCKENVTGQRYTCVRKLIVGAYIDVCGNCIMDEVDSKIRGASSEEEVDLLQCTNAPPKPLLTEGLAAASIALIILAAVIIGAAVAASGVMGTKTLINRAKGANNQSAHSNPLFEESATEMTNPAFAGDM